MTVHFKGENGAVLYYSGPVLPESIAHRLARGDLTRVTADGEPWDDNAPADGDAGPADPPTDDRDADPTPGEGDVDPQGTPPDAPPLPGVRQNRAVWTEFAISQGMDRAEANSLTKAQLIERLTTAPPAP